MKKSSLILIFLSFCISDIYLSSTESKCQNQIKDVLDEITTKKNPNLNLKEVVDIISKIEMLIIIFLIWI